MDMENRFEFCYSDFHVARSTSECDFIHCFARDRSNTYI